MIIQYVLVLHTARMHNT